MAALRTAGVAVPGDMSVVSFDEDQCLAFIAVPATSVCMPLPELGAGAVDAPIARIERTQVGDVMVSEPMNLRQRASVAPPASVRSTAATSPSTSWPSSPAFVRCLGSWPKWLP